MADFSRLFAWLLTLGALASTAGAQSAEQWLAKSAALAERAPYSVDYTMEASLEQGGSTISTTVTAELLFAAQDRMRMDIDMAIQAPSLGGAMEMEALMVADGEHVWIEMDNPMTGLQVMKTPVGKLGAMSAQTGLPGMSGNLDPFDQLESLSRWMTFEVTGKTDDSVTLTGTPTDEFEEQFGATAAALGDRMVLQLRTDGAPLRMTLGTEEAAVMTMTFENYEFLDPGDLSADVFEYTPPEGAAVISQ